jgi:galactokinase
MIVAQAAGGDNLLALDPVPTLLDQLRSELSAQFVSDRPTRISRAPGRLDVMGGIADYTGSLVCQATLDRAAAVALQERNDRNLHIFSFNLQDEQQLFTFGIPLDALAELAVDQLRADFNKTGRGWVAYIAGCLKILHEHELLDLRSANGLNLAIYSTVPLGAGVSSSAAIEVATMMNLCGHFALLAAMEPMLLAAMCQEVENRIVGVPCGIMDQVASCSGQADSLLRLLCQPHELQSPLAFPPGIRAVGIDSRIKRSVGGGMYGKTRCAAFMGHAMILAKMREMGQAVGRTLEGDPMNGYLANLDPDDYKRFFRPYLPEQMPGQEFLARYGSTIDRATKVDPSASYHVQRATDHHVLEAKRVRGFVSFLEGAQAPPENSEERNNLLNKAGHLMYASHMSYTNDALLGADECDLLVQMVREREFAGLYGAKITGGGGGGTVAVLCDVGPEADAAIAAIMAEYQRRTGNQPRAFLASSPGAWQVGTATV